MATLAGRPAILPRELWDQILSYLSPTSLRSILLSHSDFSSLATRLLYKDITCGAFRRLGICYQAQRLLRTFLTRPELAEHVRKISLMGWYSSIEDNDTHGILATFNAEEMQRLEEAIGSLPLSAHDQNLWREHLMTGRNDAYAALLLFKLSGRPLRTVELRTVPHVGPPYRMEIMPPHFQPEHLETKVYREYRTDWVPKPKPDFLSNCVCTILDHLGRIEAFPNLETVDYREGWDECQPLFQIFEWSGASIILNLRGVKKLQLGIFYPGPSVLDGLPAVLPALTTLVLESCYVSVLAAILRITPNLRHLTYHAPLDMEIQPESRGTLNLTELRAALLQVRPTLSSLRIKAIAHTRTTQEFTDYHDSRGLAGCLGSLHEFVALRMLEGSRSVLFGWQPPDVPVATMLPPGLVELRIREDLYAFWEDRWSDDEVFGVLRELMDMRGRSRGGMLQRLVLMMRRELTINNRWKPTAGTWVAQGRLSGVDVEFDMSPSARWMSLRETRDLNKEEERYDSRVE